MLSRRGDGGHAGPLQVLRDPVSLVADELSERAECDTGSCGLLGTPPAVKKSSSVAGPQDPLGVFDGPEGDG